MFYQRILVSHDKESVAKEIEVVEPKPEYESIVKNLCGKIFAIYVNRGRTP